MKAAQASAPAENRERGFMGMILNNLTQTAKVARPDLPLSGNQALQGFLKPELCIRGRIPGAGKGVKTVSRNAGRQAEAGLAKLKR
jgi:hypothetical protein